MPQFAKQFYVIEEHEPNIYSLIPIILLENLVNEISHKENIYINDKIRDDMLQW